MSQLVFYLCDRKACENCSDECMYTSDVSHAINFNKINIDNDVHYIEKQELKNDYLKTVNLNKKDNKNG